MTHIHTEQQKEKDILNFTRTKFYALNYNENESLYNAKFFIKSDINLRCI